MFSEEYVMIHGFFHYIHEVRDSSHLSKYLEKIVSFFFLLEFTELNVYIFRYKKVGADARQFPVL